MSAPGRGERVLGDVSRADSAAPPPDHGAMAPAWPNLFFRELLAVLLAMIVLTTAALVFDAPLEEPADPAHTPNPAKAPWYFVGLQELLATFDPWVAGVAIPLVIVFGLIAVPYVDPARKAAGGYDVRGRPLASAIFLTGLTAWFALIAIGLWFRGPGWAWTWPGGSPAAAETTRALPNLLGTPLALAFLAGGGALVFRRAGRVPGLTGPRRWLFTLLFLAMASVLLRVALRLLFGVRHLGSF
ncbi:MAG TPA: hypothetical protein VKU85_17535 [bacterium]|nr:hypothetical protein [bacterium]